MRSTFDICMHVRSSNEQLKQSKCHFAHTEINCISDDVSRDDLAQPACSTSGSKATPVNRSFSSPDMFCDQTVPPAIPSDSAIPPAAPSTSADDGSTDIYQAERILKEKVPKGKRQYYIKWLGLSSRHNAREPEQNILDPRLTEAFYPQAAQKEEPPQRQATNVRLLPWVILHLEEQSHFWTQEQFMGLLNCLYLLSCVVLELPCYLSPCC